MKFRIIENKSDASKFVDLIVRDCQPFLKEAKENKFKLLHGANLRMNEKSEKYAIFGNIEVFKKRARKNREPADSSPEFTKIVDDFLQKNYNLGDWRPRTQSKFFTNELTATYQYGEAYVAFPIGEFKYMWNPILTDLWVYTQNSDMPIHEIELIEDILQGRPISDNNNILSSGRLEIIHNFLEKLKKYKTDNLDKALNLKTEIMIGPPGVEFYLIEYGVIPYVENEYIKRYEKSKKQKNIIKKPYQHNLYPESFRIKEYKINSDGTLDVLQDVDLYDTDLKKLPFYFNKIEGNFDCGYNHLKSLKGAPKIVEGFFDCANNELTSLKYVPEKVKKSFYCQENNLKTLDDLNLDDIGDKIDIRDNPNLILSDKEKKWINLNPDRLIKEIDSKSALNLDLKPVD